MHDYRAEKKQNKTKRSNNSARTRSPAFRLSVSCGTFLSGIRVYIPQTTSHTVCVITLAEAASLTESQSIYLSPPYLSNKTNRAWRSGGVGGWRGRSRKDRMRVSWGRMNTGNFITQQNVYKNLSQISKSSSLIGYYEENKGLSVSAAAGTQPHQAWESLLISLQILTSHEKTKTLQYSMLFYFLFEQLFNCSPSVSSSKLSLCVKV